MFSPLAVLFHPDTMFTHTHNLLLLFIAVRLFTGSALCRRTERFLSSVGIGGIVLYPIISCHLSLMYRLNLVCPDSQFRGEPILLLYTHLEVDQYINEWIYKSTLYINILICHSNAMNLNKNTSSWGLFSDILRETKKKLSKLINLNKLYISDKLISKFC